MAIISSSPKLDSWIFHRLTHLSCSDSFLTLTYQTQGKVNIGIWTIWFISQQERLLLLDFMWWWRNWDVPSSCTVYWTQLMFAMDPLPPHFFENLWWNVYVGSNKLYSMRSSSYHIKHRDNKSMERLQAVQYLRKSILNTKHSFFTVQYPFKKYLTSPY